MKDEASNDPGRIITTILRRFKGLEEELMKGMMNVYKSLWIL